MAILNDSDALNEAQMNEMNPFTMRAVPGQSLTGNPDETPPWERPPEFTQVAEALDAIVTEFLEPEKFVALIQLLALQRMSIAALAQAILEDGFREGRWNPDLMLLLAEPLMVILMAISERAEIRDYEIYDGERNELDEDDEYEFSKNIQTGLNQHLTFKGMEGSIIEKGSVPSELLEKIQETPIQQESLLAMQEQVPTQSNSLLGQ
jgi:hypothetical protein